jgi:glyoxylase-like metal-dependent hydrolase (beta-lactamase superfamily II)
VADLAPLDLGFQGQDRAIGVYLVATDDGHALFDCGPASSIPRLKEGLAARGLALEDVRHLLLSHIHLDHAGAAGSLVREHPGLQVHVSEVGARHLVDPTRLEASARRLYGDAFDTLWGELAPVPDQNVHVAGARVVGLECFAAPGHAGHHVCYFDGATLFAGDAAGVRIPPYPSVLPPTPPPEFELGPWLTTLDEIERRTPERLALIHFGVVEEPREHVPELRARLVEWVERVERGATEDEFAHRARADAGAGADAYEHAMPFWQSYAGLKRYVEKRA